MLFETFASNCIWDMTLTSLKHKTSELYGMLLAIWDHTVLPATQVNAPRLIPSRKAGTWFTCLGRMEGWADLGVVAYQDGVPACRQVTHPSIIWAHCNQVYLQLLLLPFQGHMIFVSPYAISYWRSIGTKLISPAVLQIFGPNTCAQTKLLTNQQTRWITEPHGGDN